MTLNPHKVCMPFEKESHSFHTLLGWHPKNKGDGRFSDPCIRHMHLHAILEITVHCDYSNSFAKQEVQKS